MQIVWAPTCDFAEQYSGCIIESLHVVMLSPLAVSICRYISVQSIVSFVVILIVIPHLHCRSYHTLNWRWLCKIFAQQWTLMEINENNSHSQCKRSNSNKNTKLLQTFLFKLQSIGGIDIHLNFPVVVWLNLRGNYTGQFRTDAVNIKCDIVDWRTAEKAKHKRFQWVSVCVLVYIVRVFSVIMLGPSFPVVCSQCVDNVDAVMCDAFIRCFYRNTKYNPVMNRSKTTATCHMSLLEWHGS